MAINIGSRSRMRAAGYGPGSIGRMVQDGISILLFGAGLVISVAWGVWLAAMICIGFITYLVISFGRD